MSGDTAEYLVSEGREETVRTGRVPLSDLSNLSVSLSIGGEARVSLLEDVESHVGPIGRGDEFRVTEHGTYYRITVYRTAEICAKSGCSATAESKLDGTWLCESHLSSYAAQYIG